eukprot:SM000006S19335  [mRNA]  locus=s6:85064:91307:+ [translate_table: standard]
MRSCQVWLPRAGESKARIGEAHSSSTAGGSSPLSVCLACAHVGCAQHARQHWAQRKDHALALDAAALAAWCFRCDAPLPLPALGEAAAGAVAARGPEDVTTSNSADDVPDTSDAALEGRRGAGVAAAAEDESSAAEECGPLAEPCPSLEQQSLATAARLVRDRREALADEERASASAATAAATAAAAAAGPSEAEEEHAEATAEADAEAEGGKQEEHELGNVDRRRPVRGLVNLGSTCFFNSVMQNLVALEPLRLHFLGNGAAKLAGVVEGPLSSALRSFYRETEAEVPTAKARKDKGYLLSQAAVGSGYKRHRHGQGGASKASKADAALREQGPLAAPAYNPRSLFGVLCSRAPRFKGFQQQDSHELLRCLLDALQTEELQIQRRCPAAAPADGPESRRRSRGQPEADPAQRALVTVDAGKEGTGCDSRPAGSCGAAEGKEEEEELDVEVELASCNGDSEHVEHIAEPPVAPSSPNGEPCGKKPGSADHSTAKTLVDELFGGQLSSTVICCACRHSSVVLEPFLDLSLPIPAPASPERSTIAAGARAAKKPTTKQRSVARERARLVDAVADLGSSAAAASEEVGIEASAACSLAPSSDSTMDVMGRTGGVTSSVESSCSGVNNSGPEPGSRALAAKETGQSDTAIHEAPGVADPEHDEDRSTCEDLASGVPLDVVVQPTFQGVEKSPSSEEPQSSLSLAGCLYEFIKPERLSGQDAWACEACAARLCKGVVLEERQEAAGDNLSNEESESCLYRTASAGEQEQTDDKNQPASVHDPVSHDESCVIEESEEVAEVAEGVKEDAGNGVEAERASGSDGAATEEVSIGDQFLDLAEEALPNGATVSSEELADSRSVCARRNRTVHKTGRLHRRLNASGTTKAQEVRAEGPNIQAPGRRKQDAMKQFLISKAPQVLIVHLKRFAQDSRGHLSKLGGHVTFNEWLDVSPYIDMRSSKEVAKTCCYRLVGVVEHTGTLRGGHYVTYPPVIENRGERVGGNEAACGNSRHSNAGKGRVTACEQVRYRRDRAGEGPLPCSNGRPVRAAVAPQIPRVSEGRTHQGHIALPPAESRAENPFHRPPHDLQICNLRSGLRFVPLPHKFVSHHFEQGERNGAHLTIQPKVQVHEALALGSALHGLLVGGWYQIRWKQSHGIPHRGVTHNCLSCSHYLHKVPSAFRPERRKAKRSIQLRTKASLMPTESTISEKGPKSLEALMAAAHPT